MPSIGPLFEEKILIAIATLIVAGAPPGAEVMIEVLEREIERLDKVNLYMGALWSLVGGVGEFDDDHPWRDEWALIRATPAQRAQAFLQTVGAPES